MVEERPQTPKQTDQNPILFVPQLTMQLSSGKVQDILDTTLEKCYLPLFRLSWFKEQLSYLFVEFEKNYRLKLSKKSREDFVFDFFNLIQIEEEGAFSFKMREIGLDRTYLQEIIFRFLALTKPLIQLDLDVLVASRNNQIDLDASTQLLEIERIFDNISKDTLIKMYKEIRYWFDIYLRFKHMVAAKFYRLAYKFAKTRAFEKHNVDLECLFKSLLLTLDVAIGKYDAEKGTLTSYIQTWLKGYILNEGCSYEIGQAFKLSSWNLKSLERHNISSYTISTDSDDYKELQRKEEESFNYNFNDLDSLEHAIDKDLLRAINQIDSENVKVACSVLGVPKVLS